MADGYRLKYYAGGYDTGMDAMTGFAKFFFSGKFFWENFFGKIGTFYGGRDLTHDEYKNAFYMEYSIHYDRVTGPTKNVKCLGS